MHELGIVFHIINEIEDVGKENELETVSSVTVEIGEASGVLHDYLEDCWKWACSKSELMNGAELKVEVIGSNVLRKLQGRIQNRRVW